MNTLANKAMSRNKLLWQRCLAHLNIPAVNKMLEGDSNMKISDEKDIVRLITSQSLITLIDDYSRSYEIGFMKRRDEILKKLQEYKSRVENFHEKKVYEVTMEANTY